MRYTLNQINQKLSDFASSHLQVNSYAFGELEEISNQEVVNFPFMFALIKPGVLGRQSTEINISIILADMVHKDLSNRLEVQSDLLQIGNDLRAYLSDPDFDELFTIEEDNIPYTPFADRFNDDVTGHVFDFKFKIIDQKDRCAIPD